MQDTKRTIKRRSVKWPDILELIVFATLVAIAIYAQQYWQHHE